MLSLQVEPRSSGQTLHLAKSSSLSFCLPSATCGCLAGCSGSGKATCFSGFLLSMGVLFLPNIEPGPPDHFLLCTATTAPDSYFLGLGLVWVVAWAGHTSSMGRTSSQHLDSTICVGNGLVMVHTLSDVGHSCFSNLRRLCLVTLIDGSTDLSIIDATSSVCCSL